MNLDNLKRADKEIYRLIKKEEKRQEETLDFIASENIMPSAVLESLASVLANKYSEGYAGARYYPGNEVCDEIEELAKKRALAAFSLSSKEWGVNVQPYSGSPANLAVYLGLLEPGETIMGLKLASGGHLTHGHKVSVTGRIFKSIQYGTGEDEKIDYESLKDLAEVYRPKVLVSGTTAYPRKLDFKKFGEAAKRAGAYHVADISHIAGLVAAKLHQSPFTFADVVTMTTHKTMRGPRGAVIFMRKELEEKINKSVFPGLQGGPHNNVTAAMAVAFKEAVSSRFKKYQQQVVKNAAVIGVALKEKAFDLVTGGTDNHLLVINMKSFGLTGMEAEKKLQEVGIIANRNAVPGDEKPYRPSGIRIGTPAVTARGMKEGEMRQIAEIIFNRLVGGEKVLKLKKEVLELARRFPMSGV